MSGLSASSSGGVIAKPTNAKLPERGRKPMGLALTVGLNKVNSDHYAGWEGPLLAAEGDTELMGEIAQKSGFSVRRIRGPEATRDKIKTSIREAAGKLYPGDIFLFHFSGHGGVLPDTNGDEADGQDEVYCLYDGMLIDDEIYGLWAGFRRGVRILAFVDSCHSGTAAGQHPPPRLTAIIPDNVIEPPPQPILLTPPEPGQPLTPSENAVPKQYPTPRRVASQAVIKERLDYLMQVTPGRSFAFDYTKIATEEGTRTRSMIASEQVSRLDLPEPGEIRQSLSEQVYANNREFYDSILIRAHQAYKYAIQASVLAFAACRDQGAAIENTIRGEFTGKVYDTWSKGSFQGNYHMFYNEVAQKLNGQPMMMRIGAADSDFSNQRAFSV